jgi:DUF438 domain-containing protein
LKEGKTEMSVLTEELKSDHELILGLINDARELGVGSPGSTEKIRELERALTAHVEKEAELLYPALEKAATGNLMLTKTLEFFRKDMSGISRDVAGFVEKHSSAPDQDFAHEIAGLLVTMQDRIRKEESVLYREFEKLSPSVEQRRAAG